jgi:caffeoyl-CoA O-methyltransferase
MLESVRIDEQIEAYMLALLRPREGVLGQVEREAEAANVPAIGPAVGQLLQLVVSMARARRILELGTATGYSGIWLLRGSVEAELTSLELNPERAASARRNLEAAGLADRARVVEEDGVAFLERSRERYDLIFNDLLNSFSSEAVVEKCFGLCLDRLGPGGLLVADNALRRGEVVRPQGQGARNVALWNRLVSQSERLESVLLPLRDGVLLARVREV